MDEHELSECANDWTAQTGCFGAARWGLYGMAVGLNAQVMLEVGVGRGGSTRAFLLAAARTGGRLWSIDDQDRYDVVPLALRERWTFIQGRSQDILRNLGAHVERLPSEPIDLLFLDGEHVYDVATVELHHLGAQMRRTGQGSLIVLDDCWPLFPGVLRAFEEYRHCRGKWIIPYGVAAAQPGGRDRAFGVIRV